jgi:hypothetical protein
VVAAEPASFKLVVAPATIHKLRCGIRGRRGDGVCDALWPARVVLRWMGGWMGSSEVAREKKVACRQSAPHGCCARLDLTSQLNGRELATKE